MVKYKIKRLGIVNTSLIVAGIYFVIGIVVLLPFGALMSMVGAASGDEIGAFAAIFSGVTLIFLPVLYAILGFIITAIVCLIFNLIAPRVGGLEVYMEVEGGSETV